MRCGETSPTEYLSGARACSSFPPRSQALFGNAARKALLCEQPTREAELPGRGSRAELGNPFNPFNRGKVARRLAGAFREWHIRLRLASMNRISDKTCPSVVLELHHREIFLARPF